VGNARGSSRGDRNRNARLARLRVLVPAQNAIVGIDLADKKQMVVFTDHDSRVLARRTFRCRAWDLGAALDWAAQRAAIMGFAGVTVASEPTGHRWRVVGQLTADRGMPFVCVQPLQMSWARRSEDLTFDKTDDKDAVLIARLARAAALLHPGAGRPRLGGRLRHLGARREQLISEAAGQIQQMRPCWSACGQRRWMPPSIRSSRRRGRRRSWPRPATREGSLRPERWSSMPGWRRGRSCPAPSSAAPSSPVRPTGASAGRVACSMGSVEGQSRLRRPLPAHHRPRTQQAQADPGADRDGLRSLAAAARRRHHR